MSNTSFENPALEAIAREMAEEDLQIQAELESCCGSADENDTIEAHLPEQRELIQRILTAAGS